MTRRMTRKAYRSHCTQTVGQESGYHTLNSPKSPEQRRTITAYHGSVDLFEEPLAVVHGNLSP
jgi:hypothetical protein